MADISFKVEDQGIINSVKGQVGFEDISEFITANIDKWIGKSVIWDLSEMDFNHVMNVEIRNFAHVLSDISLKRKGQMTAFVAPQDLQYGMMRMLETFVELESIEIDLHICRALEEAKSMMSGGRGK